ncbi:MAG: XTP/dITP diphosphatase [Endomicrobium sp.]|uniref:XTP/dITP diphosphatase n=1 Tax=Candidatus Endomicrobiellum cubanum TaxID=3242325 RepID=UPI002823550F|nr:XTP/dITP diphosphatase [Endomicrobium sp.]
MKKIVVATTSKYKQEEIKSLLKDLDIEVISMTSFKEYPKTIENGKTLQENAIKKAKEAAKFFNSWVIADDTGLEVDYLNGEPGVLTARYAGEHCNFADNIKKLLNALIDVPFEKRTARFRTVIAIASPTGQIYLSKGEIYGIINYLESGAYNFGYDPVFYVPEYNKTFAELTSDIKNTISHRAKALQKAKMILKQL